MEKRIAQMEKTVKDIIAVLDAMIPHVFAEQGRDVTNASSAILEYPQYDLNFETLLKEIREEKDSLS